MITHDPKEKVNHRRGDGRGYYSRAGQFFGVDRSPGLFNQRGQFVSIGSSGSIGWPRVRPANAQDDCIFDPATNLGSIDSNGFDCWDSYGIFGETNEQCLARQQGLCWTRRDSCFNSAFISFSISMGACAFLTSTNPIAGTVCMAVAYLQYINSLASCDSVYQNCLLGIPDRCRR